MEARARVGTLFCNTQVPTGGNFTASFTYTCGGNKGADGFAFVLQQQAATAIGANGGARGYGGITPSVSLQFNIYTGGGGTIGTTYAINGNTPADTAFDAVLPVNLSSGNPINITIAYNAALQTLTVSLAEQNTTNTFSRTYNGVNLLAVLNGNAAWAGFTGGTGGVNAINHQQFHPH